MFYAIIILISLNLFSPRNLYIVLISLKIFSPRNLYIALISLNILFSKTFKLIWYPWIYWSLKPSNCSDIPEYISFWNPYIALISLNIFVPKNFYNLLISLNIFSPETSTLFWHLWIYFPLKPLHSSDIPERIPIGWGTNC